MNKGRISTPGFLCFLILMFLIVSGCSSSDALVAPVTTSVIDVYVTGYRLDGSDAYAPIWKNGVKLYDLTDTTHNVYANSIYVSGGSVYAVGYYYDGGSIPAFWKDESAPIAFTTASNPGTANSVYVSGSNVYVTGWYNDGLGNNVAAVWVSSNGGTSFNAPTILPATGNNTLANSIYVSGNDVYVTGTYRPDKVDIAVVWISSDGGSSFAKTDLPDQGFDQASANSIYVSSGNVYVAGSYYNSENTIAAVWVSSNGGTSFNTPTDLMTDIDADANSIYVSGGSVYVAGYYNDGSGNVVAAVWVSSNGGTSFNTPTDLITGESVNATSIYVSGDIVYVAGYYNDSSNNIAAVWVSSDGGSSFVKNDLTVTGSDASASSIYVDVH